MAQRDDHTFDDGVDPNGMRPDAGSGDAHDDDVYDGDAHAGDTHDDADNGGAAEGGRASSGFAREGIVLTAEQQEALAGLTAENTYAKQSKWRTFVELPLKDKWPFFVQHFLVGTLIVILAVGMVGSLVYEYVTKDPDPLLYIAGVNMPSDIAEQMDELESDLAEDADLDPELMSYDDNFVITESGTYDGQVDSSSRLMVMATAGTINTIITDADTFEDLSGRGLVSPLSDVLDDETIDELEQAGVTVTASSSEAQGGEEQIKGLDLSHSATWTAMDDMPDGMILGFSNVTESGVEYPQALVEYLDFS